MVASVGRPRSRSRSPCRCLHWNMLQGDGLAGAGHREHRVDWTLVERHAENNATPAHDFRVTVIVWVMVTAPTDRTSDFHTAPTPTGWVAVRRIPAAPGPVIVRWVPGLRAGRLRRQQPQRDRYGARPRPFPARPPSDRASCRQECRSGEGPIQCQFQIGGVLTSGTGRSSGCWTVWLRSSTPSVAVRDTARWRSPMCRPLRVSRGVPEPCVFRAGSGDGGSGRRGIG